MYDCEIRKVQFILSIQQENVFYWKKLIKISKLACYLFLTTRIFAETAARSFYVSRRTSELGTARFCTVRIVVRARMTSEIHQVETRLALSAIASFEQRVIRKMFSVRVSNFIKL